MWFDITDGVHDKVYSASKGGFSFLVSWGLIVNGLVTSKGEYVLEVERHNEVPEVLVFETEDELRNKVKEVTGKHYHIFEDGVRFEGLTKRKRSPEDLDEHCIKLLNQMLEVSTGVSKEVKKTLDRVDKFKDI